MYNTKGVKSMSKCYFFSNRRISVVVFGNKEKLWMGTDRPKGNIKFAHVTLRHQTQR